jgi:hypothetical protein
MKKPAQANPHTTNRNDLVVEGEKQIRDRLVVKQPADQRVARLTTVATFILASGGIVCVLVLLYFIYYYAWMGHRSLTKPVELILYYVIPAVSAGVLFGSLTLDPIWRINLSLVLLSTCISIYAANLFVFLYDTKRAAASRTLDGSSERDLREVLKLATKYGIDYDARGRLKVIDDLYGKGINAVPRVAPVNLLREQPEDGTWKSVISLDGIEVLPHGGISNSATVYCNEGGQYVIYQSDEYGFHNPKGLWNSTPIDIVALGDSFTQGACVPSGKNFVALIRERFSRTLNLSMGGNGPLNELATLMDYLEVLRPKIVLWFFFEGNDILDLHRERKSPLLMRYLTGNFRQVLLHRQAEIDQALLAFISIERDRFNFTFPVKPRQIGKTITQASDLLQKSIKLSYLRQRLSSSLALLHGKDSHQSDPTTEVALDLLPNVLSQAKASADAWGSKLYFVFLPQRERYSDGNFRDETRQRVLSVVKELEIPVIDLHPAFQNRPDPLDLFPFRRMYHYNEKGHQLVSDVVLRHISQ